MQLNNPHPLLERDGNVLRVDFRRQPDPPAPKFPGAGALRGRSLAAAEETFTTAKPNGGHMSKKLSALLLAGTLLAPGVSAASASGGTDGIGAGRTELRIEKPGIALPTPNLDAVPWLNLDLTARSKANDLPLGCSGTKDPLWLQPAEMTTQMSFGTPGRGSQPGAGSRHTP